MIVDETGVDNIILPLLTETRSYLCVECGVVKLVEEGGGEEDLNFCSFLFCLSCSMYSRWAASRYSSFDWSVILGGCVEVGNM